jgi:hypothetical protein
MPGKGPAPKAVRSRPNDTARRQAEIQRLEKDGEIRGPELPDGDWHPRTIVWWDNWRRSPQAQHMAAVDWDFMVDTAMMHSQMWNGDLKMAAEVRIRVAKFGATPEDRLRLKVQVDEDLKPEVRAPKTKARRAHLLKVVSE